MRIVASVCLVLAILFMVGCGTSAEDKKLITDQGTKLTQLEKKADDMAKMAGEMGKKVAEIEAFLKDPKSKMGGYGVVDTTKKPPAPAAVKPGATPPAAPKAPEKAKPATKTKG